jgi:tetratricopeptide (TPR) repeat protein
VVLGRHGETLVVDWGLAKALGRTESGVASDERVLVPYSSSGSAETLPGSALGTPAYMSPEQAGGDLDRLRPRSDVYSLGATLYCLLTGRPPVEGDDVGAVLRAVQKGDFPPPRRLDPTIDPALEAVCLKAMALRAEDRYSTPRALAEDIEHWMADEPVAAWREPFARRARRWARRHRPAVTGAAAALLAGVVGLAAVAAVQTQANARLKGAYADIARANVRLRDANAATTRALAETSEAKKATEKALGESEESRRQAEAVSTFVVASFRSSDPRQDGRQVKVADLLDRAAEKLDKGFSGTQATKGALLDALGETYFGLGLNDKAVATHTKARAVRETALGPDHPDTLASRNNLAEAFRGAGRTAEAIALHEETLKLKESRLGPDHPETLASRHNLATAYWAAGRMSEAIALHEATLRLFESRLGPDHPNTLTSRANLASAYWSAGRVSEAIVLNEGTLKLRESKLGPDHPNTLVTRTNLAVAYVSVGRTSEAIALHSGTLKLRESKLGPDHPDTLTGRHSLAVAYRASGRTSDAVALWEGMLPTARRVFGPGHPNTLTTTTSLASALESLGRWAEAEALWREVLGQRRKAAPTDSPPLADALDGLGRNLGNRSRWSEAEALLRESLALRAKAPPDDWRRFSTMSLLGGALLGQGRYAEAEPLVVQGYEGMRAREAKIPAPNKPRLFEVAERVARLYEAWGKPAHAQAWKEKLGLADLPADVFARP